MTESNFLNALKNAGWIPVSAIGKDTGIEYTYRHVSGEKCTILVRYTITTANFHDAVMNTLGVKGTTE